MKLDFEYGHGMMSANLPDDTDVFISGKTVVIVIPDIVKGGCQPTAHRKVSITACLDELYAGGVKKEDILFMFSNGLHPRATESQMKQILGEKLFNYFYWTNQITSHDSEDKEHMVDLGTTKRGDPVLMNKYVFDCDIPILIGQRFDPTYLHQEVTETGKFEPVSVTFLFT